MKTSASDAIIDLIDSGQSELRSDTQGARAYREIRRAILECRLAPGSTIDEKSLTRELELGRTPVREALLRLSSVRLVQFVSGQAIQVAPIGLKDIRDLYEDRLHSERLAAFLAARRMGPEEIDAMQHNFDGAAVMLSAGLQADTIALDFRFHSMIYRGAKNAVLSEHLHNLFAHSYRLWRLAGTDDPSRISAIIRSHEPLIDALSRRDAQKADALIVEHIGAAFQSLLETIRGDSFNEIGRMTVATLGPSGA